MKSKLLYVEFIGIPGAGKTALANEVISMLPYHKCFGRPVMSNLKKLETTNIYFVKYSLLFSGFILRRFRLIIFAFRYLCESNVFNSLRSVCKLIFVLYRIEVAIRKCCLSDYDFILLDQGILQELWSISINGNLPANEFVIRVVECLNTQKIFIAVDIDANEALKRIGNRLTMTSRFDRMPSVKAKALLRENLINYTKIIDSVRSTDRTRILEVNGMDELSKNASYIKDIMLQTQGGMLHRGSTPQ